MYLFKDKGGNNCAAKTWFSIALIVCLIKIIFAGVTVGDLALAEANYAGMATFLTPLAGAYGWRSQTKAK